MSDLFQPFSCKNLILSNRVVMAPMTRNKSPNNVPNDDVVEYYRLRAAGGTGLIITEGTIIGHKAASGYPDVPSIASQESLLGWKKVVDAVHAEGGKIAVQLWHVGVLRTSGIAPGGDTPAYSPSGILLPGKTRGIIMSKADIDEIIDAYMQAAKNALAIGFDAVEVHGAHGYLIDQFFWEGTNQREDEYGGNMSNRGRFANEVIRAIRTAVGKEFPIIFRFSQWKQQDYNVKLATTPQQLSKFLAPLVDAGVDMFHCSTRKFWQPEFEHSTLTLAGWTKKLTAKPSIAVGSISLDTDFFPAPGEKLFKSGNIANLNNLSQRLQDDEFDLVAVGRAMIANPDWCNQVKIGQLQSLKNYDKNMLETLI